MLNIRKQSNQHRSIVSLLLLCALLLNGCSRRFWRQQAETDSYHAITEKLNDERWLLPRIALNPDERSRFYDPYDPDCAPLPPDDPAAHCYMHCANGHEGYKHWHAMGDTISVENPNWLEPYSGLINAPDPTQEHQNVEIPRVTLKDSVELTYIHSREYQTQIEDVYLSALALTGDRYILGTRFRLGGPGLGGGLFRASRSSNGTRSRSLTNGIGIQQLLPTGAQLSADIINTISWNMADGTSTATGLAWGLTQPFLNAAGRKVVLESLTQSERILLYEIRDMARFRQTLFTGVASDYLRLQQQAQTIRNRENNIRQLETQIEAGRVGDSFRKNTVGADLEALPEDIEVRDGLAGQLKFSDDRSIPEALADQLRFRDGRLLWTGDMTEEQQQQIRDLSADEDYLSAAEALIGWRTIEVDSLGVLQLVTRLNNAESQLASAKRQLNDQLDSFKIRLGLPPNVAMTIDDRFLQPFELIDTKLLYLADELREFAKVEGPSLIAAPRGGGADERTPPTLPDLKQYVTQLAEFRDDVATIGLEGVKEDFTPVRGVLAGADGNSQLSQDGRDFGSSEERDRVIRDVARDLRNYRINTAEFQRWSRAIGLFERLLEAGDENALISAIDTNGDGMIQSLELPPEWKDLPQIASTRSTDDMTAGQFVGTIRDAAITIREKLLQIVQSVQVVQAGLRVETIALNKFHLYGGSETPGIEEVIRIGLENRHDLMNQRAIVMDARRNVEVVANALKARLDLDVNGTAGFTGNLDDDVNLSVDFKTPIDQVMERNRYSAALVNYQRARRDYMALEDLVKQQIRESWRQLQVSEQRLEIDRQTVRSAALQYDNLSFAAAQNNNLSLLNALDSILNAQNSLVGDWITYETNRLNIFRDMGIMDIDQSGIWQDEFYVRDGQLSDDSPPATTVMTPELQSDIPPEQLTTDPVSGAANNAANAGSDGPAEVDLPMLEIPDNE